MSDITYAVDWDAVYWKYMPGVFRYFCYQVGDEALAEDLTATTLIKAWKARDAYNHQRGSIATWLYAIARNTTTDYFRRRQDDLPLDLVSIRSEEDRPVEAAIEQNQELLRLAMVMDQLSERERDLIALKYGAGLTNRTIAGLAGISESNVGTILHRAVGRLRAAWEMNEYE